MNGLHRREFLASLASSMMVGNTIAFQPKAKKITLGFSNYGMKTIAYKDAIPYIGKVGFDSLELCLLPGWPTEPKKLSASDRKEIVTLIEDSKLKLTALMENLAPSPMPEVGKGLQDRLEHAFSLANELGGKNPPLVQTVLGGGVWEKVQTLYVDTLGKWTELAAKAKVILAIKPHRSGAMNLPSQAIWLIEQLKNNPWLKMVYDPSHLMFRDLDLVKMLKDSLPHVAHVAIKDAAKRDGKIVFDLAGSTNSIDYGALIKVLKEGNYQGDVNCEVSSMVSEKAGYDPLKSAQTCKINMRKYFE
ncbi:MAG: sugar phosphate isomerase/epimerase [Planctomycetes bacterium]|nr:sugar phosphate isomerase/epimerase [Planctomycetota bacterium]